MPVVEARGQEVGRRRGHGRGPAEARGLVRGRRRVATGAQEPGEADALSEPWMLTSGARGLLVEGLGRRALLLMDEVAATPVGTVSEVVEGPTGLGFVLGVPVEASQFTLAVRKLTLAAILADAAFLEAPAEFRLVAVGRLDRQRWESRRRRHVERFDFGAYGQVGRVVVCQAHGAVGSERILRLPGLALTPYVEGPSESLLAQSLLTQAPGREQRRHFRVFVEEVIVQADVFQVLRTEEQQNVVLNVSPGAT